MVVIHSLKDSASIFIGEFAVIHYLGISSAVLCLFPQNVASSYAFFQRYYDYLYKILAAIHSFSSIVHFSDTKICSDPILPTHFPSAYFRTPVTAKQISYRNSCIFRAESIILKRKQLLEAAIFFRRKNFFRIPSCLEKLLLSFFLTTSW